MKTAELVDYLDAILSPQTINDYCPNGLQIQGSEQINHIVTGVTASQALIDKAIELCADAILVHHGYFWKNETQVIKGMKYRRIKALMLNDLNLLAYHLPLDIHATLGNNAQLGKLLGFTDIQPLALTSPQGIVMQANLDEPYTGTQCQALLTHHLQRHCLHLSPPSDKPIKTVAWCTGGGQHYIEQVAELGIDAFISGEVSEQTTHTVAEMDVHFFAAGHHATERYGIKALGEHIAAQFDCTVSFIDIDNPV